MFGEFLSSRLIQSEPPVYMDRTRGTTHALGKEKRIQAKSARKLP